jgi:hypothetical protein
LDSMGRLMPLRLGPSGKQNPAVFLDQTTCPVPGLVQSPAVKVTITSLCFSTLDLGLAGMCPVPPISARGRFRTPLASVAQRRKPAWWDHFWHSPLYQCTESRPAGTTFSQSRPAGSTFHGPAGTTCPTVPGRWLGVRATCRGHRGTNASSPAAGDLFPLLVKTDPHHRRGSNFRPGRDSIPTGQISAPPRRRARQPPHEIKGPTIGNAIHRRARRRSSPRSTTAIPSLPQKPPGANPKFLRPCKQL